MPSLELCVNGEMNGRKKNTEVLAHPSRRTQLQLVNTSPIGVRFEDTENVVEKCVLSSLNAANKDFDKKKRGHSATKPQY